MTNFYVYSVSVNGTCIYNYAQRTKYVLVRLSVGLFSYPWQISCLVNYGLPLLAHCLLYTRGHLAGMFSFVLTSRSTATKTFPERENYGCLGSLCTGRASL